MKTIVTFGEIMARLEIGTGQKLWQSLPGGVGVTFAGAEASVAASLAIFGKKTEFVTAVPDNDIGKACTRFLRGLGVGLTYTSVVPNSRLGLYFLETGANQRPSKITYDRKHSAVSEAPAAGYDWKTIFSDAEWFHISGITPSISRAAADASLRAVAQAKECGATVSLDFNFRKNLWNWGPAGQPNVETAREVIVQLLPSVDVLIGNEEDAYSYLGIRAGGSDAQAGKLEIESYPSVAKQIVARFPNIRYVATTLRESI
jgi:2-dehydro-3-deoxygluconokinase